MKLRFLVRSTSTVLALLVFAMSVGVYAGEPAAQPQQDMFEEEAFGAVMHAATLGRSFSAAGQAGSLPPCETAEQLAELIAANEGGVITLTGDIAVPAGESFAVEVDQPTTVQMGDYGMTFARFGGFQVSGPVHFVGSGTDKPLFHAGAYQSLVLDQCFVTAYGDHAVALQLDYYANFFPLFIQPLQLQGSIPQLYWEPAVSI